MDQSNPRGAGTDGAGRSSNRRQWVLGALLGVLVVGYAPFAFLDWYNTKVQRKGIDDYATFVTAMAKAEAIADPLQRCLSYPDLPNSHWDPVTTRAYCALRAHKTIQLSDIDALLKQGSAGEVDRTFKNYRDIQRRDPTQPGLLDIAFLNAGFGDASANTRRIIDMWKQQSPDSAFALAASGMQYVDAAQQARGHGWGRDLNDQQVQGMQDQVALAIKDFDRAASLDPSVTAMYPDMMYAGALVGNDDYLYGAAGLAMKQDPANFGLRGQMMNQAQPKWGRNFGGTAAQRAQDLSLAAKNPLLRMVAQNPAVYRATCDCYGSQALTTQYVAQAADQNLTASNLVELAGAVYQADRRRAVELYGEALRFDPANADALRWRSQEMIALGDREGAVAAAEDAYRRLPGNEAIATQLGNLYAQAGKPKQAEAVLLGVLQREPDNFDAMGVLGDLYNHAGHQPQKAEALADAMIGQHPDKANGYIVRACNQMDHNLPGVYDTIHYFIDHFGDDPQWTSQTAEMRGYLIRHPEQIAP
jgi:tetratricopeptide (TPR) repeat protein